MQEISGSLEDFADIPEKTLGFLVRNLPEGSDPLELVLSSWDEGWRAGRWTDSGGKVTFPIIGGARGDLVGVLVPNRNDGLPWRLHYAGVDKQNALDAIWRKSPVPPSLYHLAYIDWSRLCSPTGGALPETGTLHESWGFSRGDISVFKSYLYQTYTRLVYEGKVLVSDKYGLLVFNSGLVTPSYDDVYLCFERDEDSRSGWSYAGSCVAGESGLGKRLLDAFHDLPGRAEYVSDIADVVFDGSRAVVPDYRHIVADRIGRFPAGYLDRRLLGFPDLAQELDDARAMKERGIRGADEAFQRIGAFVWEENSLRNGIRGDLDAALRKASRRAQWNFRTAIPAYYPRRNSMGFLLPLCMENEDVADLVMVTSLSRAGTYIGETVLDMRMAYTNARLVNRLESEWLHA